MRLGESLGGATGRRCLYGESCWPSQDEFDQLASQVSQPLIHPVPPASPCYTSPGSAECAAVIQGWTDGIWRSNQSGAMQMINYETYAFPYGTIDACYLDTTLVAQTLMGLGSGFDCDYYFITGGTVSQVPANDTGLNPACWPEGATAAQIDQLRERLNADTATLRSLAPDSGAYLNEASSYEPNPQQAFFGAHYPSLRAIKATYDPVDLFVVAEGVGSAEWNTELTCGVSCGGSWDV